MKNTTILLLIFCFFSCSKTTKKSFNKVALSEKLITVDGKSIGFGEILKNKIGKTVVIKVWASWCGDCIKSIEKTKQIQAHNPRVSFLFISVDKTQEQWKKGIIKHQLKGQHYMVIDQMYGKFGTAIDLDWIPRYIIIDKTGKIITYRAVETDIDEMNSTLKRIL